MSDVTRILSAIEHGDAKATDKLLPLVYNEFRRTAADKMSDERSSHTPCNPPLSSTKHGSNSLIPLLNPEKPLENGSYNLLFHVVSLFEAKRRMYGR